MKMNLLAFPVVLLFSVSLVFGQQSASASRLALDEGVAPHGKIDDIYRRFSDAYEKLETKAVTNLYTDNAFYLSPQGEVQRGSEQIHTTFDGFFRSIRESRGALSVSFRILDRHVSGDLAFDVGIYTLTQKLSSGEERTSRGKFVVVVRRLKDGEWRFHVDSYGEMPRH